MRKLILTLGAAALVLGAMAVQASAQQQRGAASITALKNATPIVKVYCRGGGPNQGWACGPGRYRVCGQYRCWCRPC